MNQVVDMLDSSIENLRRLIDVDTIVGKAININGYTIIPISNVKLNFATVGVDVITKKENNPASGGVGGSVNVKPTCFLVVKEDMIKLISSKGDLSETINNAIELFKDKKPN